ncbi:MAG: hypothetical protein WCF63_02415 [Acidimicrobiales bacterium]
MGSATLAGAQGWGPHSHHGASRGAVPFSYSNNGTAVLVGTVSAISGDTITVTDPQGFTRAILVSGSTTYRQGGASVTLAAVVVGSKIFAQGTVDTNGTTLDALSVDISGGTQSQMGFDWGVITAVTSTSVTIEGRSGTSTTFSYATGTPISAVGHDKLTLSSADLVVNEHAGVEFSSSATTTATGIWVELAHVSGVVTAVSGDAITLSDRQGFTRLVLVGGATTYNSSGAAGTLADVVVGARIRAEGLVDANGTTLDALNVDICSTTTTPQPQGDSDGHHHGGFGGGFGGGAGGSFGGGSNGGQGSNFRR